MKPQYDRVLVNNSPPGSLGHFRTMSLPQEIVERIFRDSEKVVIQPLPDFSGIIVRPAKVVPK
jgi:hypothetical protein